VRLVLRDLASTIGAGDEVFVQTAAARIRLFTDDAADFEQRVVEEVQQQVHDTCVDTSWPRCPDHPNHPLWYSDKWWRCVETAKAVAPLGALGDKAGRHAG
jgi:hypothetical protein